MRRPSGRFGARHSPREVKAGDVAAIEWGRRMGVASFNDFRELVGLSRIKAWSDITSNADVQTALDELYHGDVDMLELYVGTHAEEPMPGSGNERGWGLGATMRAAIRQDAFNIALGDLFYRKLATREYLTDWGYEHLLTSGRLTTLINRHTALQVPVHGAVFHVAPEGAPLGSADTN